MGCGKSTVGAELAKRLGWRFVDLDRKVECRAGLPIPTIFRRFGEGHFRRLELEELRTVSREQDPAVIALGGGAFVSSANRRIVARTGISVWLDVPLPVIARRLGRQGKGRPLAHSPAALEALLRTRLPFYREADVRIRVANASFTAVVGAIVRVVREDWQTAASRRRIRHAGDRP
jgi:shikimate kinase